MSLRNRLKRQLRDRQFRHAYADEQLNLCISTQIKVIREKQNMSQATLAGKIGSKQTGVSRIESANYEGWSIALLRRLAEAFDLRLRVSFEEFGTLWEEVDNFNRESLQRREFEKDPEFEESSATAQTMIVERSNIVLTNTPHSWRRASAIYSQSQVGQLTKMPVGAAAVTNLEQRIPA